MRSNEMLDRAIALAVAAHAGQTDRAGQPYILHPLRVMLGESYQQFVARAGQNIIGRAVKLADLRDNSDLNRIGQQNMTEADWDRNLKYSKAIEQLLSASA